MRLKVRGGVCLVDRADYRFLVKFSWYLANGYPVNKRLGYMHRFLMGYPKRGWEVDHLNGDRSDNRARNLRLVRRAQNCQNRRSKKKYKGVSETQWGTFRAAIRVKGAYKGLGSFASSEQAARAYNAAAKKYFKEFACLNKLAR